MLVATVSYLAALNISASNLKVVDYQEYPYGQPDGSSIPIASPVGRRLQLADSLLAGTPPFYLFLSLGLRAHSLGQKLTF